MTFECDPFGRIQKSGANGTTNYLYDGENIFEEVDNSGNVLVLSFPNNPLSRRSYRVGGLKDY